jgi:hypothetical protein
MAFLHVWEAGAERKEGRKDRGNRWEEEVIEGGGGGKEKEHDQCCMPSAGEGIDTE